MPYFPQLLTGSVMQFPGSKRLLHRTVVNRQEDGREWKLSDPAEMAVEWRLELKGLTDGERAAIESLFEAVEGRLGSFLFLDPFANLLKWSEELGASAWQRDPELILTPGLPDPMGTSNAAALSNAGGSEKTISQTCGLPSWLRYCVSVYARSAEPSGIGLFAAAGAGVDGRLFRVGPAWRRIEHGVKLSGTDEAASFGAAIGPGTTVELYGFQVEPQAGASGYKKTTTRSGVFADASFLEDVLVMTADGAGCHSCTLRICARAG